MFCFYGNKPGTHLIKV